MSIILPTEWDLDEAVQVAHEEGWEKGREAEEKRFSNLLAQVNSLEDFKKLVEASSSD